MSIPDPDRLTAEEWGVIEETLQEAVLQAQSAAGAHPSGALHRLLLAQAAAVEAVLHRVRETQTRA